MKTISIEDLKTKLESDDDFKLVMTLGEWAFQAAHIPGSIHFNSIHEAMDNISKDDEIVVYCSDKDCIASQAAYRVLVNQGYPNVRRYAGGLNEWSAKGYPLEGTDAGQ